MDGRNFVHRALGHDTGQPAIHDIRVRALRFPYVHVQLHHVHFPMLFLSLIFRCNIILRAGMCIGSRWAFSTRTWAPFSSPCECVRERVVGFVRVGVFVFYAFATVSSFGIALTVSERITIYTPIPRHFVHVFFTRLTPLLEANVLVTESIFLILPLSIEQFHNVRHAPTSARAGLRRIH